MSKTMLEGLDILIEKGVYLDREELINDALRALLRSKPGLKRRIALEFYKAKKVSLSRAAEICGVNLEDFKEILKEEGVKIVVPQLGEKKVDEEVREILKIAQ